MSSENTFSDTPTLEAVKSRFDHWRTTRTKRTKIPDTLWDDVRQLSKRYGYSQISSQLGISYPQLHAHLGERDQQNSLESPTSNFINADIPFLQSPSHTPLLQWPLPNGTLEVQCNGLHFKTTGLSQQDLVVLIQTFLKH